MVYISSIIDLIHKFPTEQSCIDYLKIMRWGNGVISPFDSTSKVYDLGRNKYRCKNTGKNFNVFTNTLFEGTKLPLQKWFVAIWLDSTSKKGISSLHLSEQIHVTQKTAWFVLHRIRNCFNTDSEKLFGQVELDETFVGGKNKNRHRNKKVHNSQGRSFKDKTPILGMVERGGRIKAFVIKNTSAKSITPLVKRHVDKKAKIFTDEWCGYDKVKKIYDHAFVDHGKGQYVNGDATTNTIEGFWSILKRGIIGIYQRVSPDHLQQYVDEFVFRYCTRNLNSSDRFNLFFYDTENRLTYKQLIHG